MALEHLVHAAKQRAATRPPQPHGPRVLVVDPNATLRRALLDLLRVHDLTVAEAADCGGALDCLREWKPTVAVIEMRLRSGRTGLDALRLLREADPWLEVIIYAAATDVVTPKQARAAGAFAVFTRDRCFGELVETIRAAHRAHRPSVR